MAKKYKRNTEPTFTLSELEQYGFGDWLKKNAGTIGTVVGTGLGALAAPLTGGLSLAAGASLGSSLGGAVGGAVQQNAMQSEANAQQQQMMQQQAAMQNGAQLTNKLQGNQFQNTPTFMCGGKLRKYPNGGTMEASQAPYYSNFQESLKQNEQTLKDKAELYYYTQQFKDPLRAKNPKVYDELVSKYGWNQANPMTTATRVKGADEYAKANESFYLTPEEQQKVLGQNWGRYSELRGKYGKDYNLLGEGDNPNDPASWKVGARHAVAFNPVTYKKIYEPQQGAANALQGAIGTFDYNISYDPTLPEKYKSDVSYTEQPMQQMATRANGGYLMEYGGASHAGGGIPVDGTTGNPIAVTGAQPNAEVEGNEIAVKFPGSETPFIFSEKLGFAKQAKKIQSKYSKRPNDSISQDAMYMELGGLMQAQEQFKADKAKKYLNKAAQYDDNIAQFVNGGNLPTYEFGDPLPKIEYPELNIQDQNSPYRGSIAPLIASGVGNLAMIATNRKPDKINPINVAPEQINLEAARTSAKEQATISRANRLKALRESGLSAGQYGALASTSDADINRATNEALRESYLNEQTQNAGYRQQANVYNAGQASQANMANMELQDRYRRQNAQYLQNIAQSVPEYFAQREKYDTLNAISPNYEIVKGKYGRAKFIPKNRQ